MPVSCAAFGCKSRYTLQAREKGITFHRFPRSNPVLLEKWRIAMKRATSTGELWMPSRYQRLCSLHFKESCFDTTGQTKRLRGDVIPSIFNFPEHMQFKTEVSNNPPQETSEATTVNDPVMPVVEITEPPMEWAEPAEKDNVSSQVQLQDHLYFIPDVETLKRKLQASEDSRAQKEKELRNAKDREKRLRQTCPSIYQELGKKNLLTPQLHQRLLPYGDIPLELFKKLESEYSAQQRMFALTLHLYDAQAYKYLRNEVKLPLPGSRKMRQWLKSDCVKPGINTLVLEALLNKRQEHPQLYTRVCLVIDTIPIKKHITFDSHQNELIGFVNLGNGADVSSSREVANEALVMMLVGTAGDWKAPITYFLTRELTSGAQKQLLLHVLHELCDNGFEIVAVAMERQLRNEEMCTLLGCKIEDPRLLQTYFCLPDSENKHFILFDVTTERHLISDMLEVSGTIQGPDGGIMRQYVDDLMSLHKTAVIQAAGRCHLTEVFNQMMKAELMVNTLNNSVANFLSILQELKCDKFVDATATISFIQIMDRLFDILSSKCQRVTGDKGPVNHTNLQQKLSILQETKEYLLTLTNCDNTFLYQSPSGHAILGLLVNITSLISLLPSLLLTQDYVTTHSFSTDHLKVFYNGFRKAGVLDKEPTCDDIICSVRHLLSKCCLLNTYLYYQPSENVITFDNINEEQIPCNFRQHLPLVLQENGVMLPDHVYSSHVLNLMLLNSEMYITGWVIRKAFGVISCNKCRWALVTGDGPQDYRNAYHLLKLKNGRAFVPSLGAITTVLTAEKELYRMLKNDHFKQSSLPLLLEHRVLSILGSKDIFDLKEHISLTECGINNHYFQILRFLTSIYCSLRHAYIIRLSENRQYRHQVKQILTKNIEYFL
ncbi:DNA transposase THAP9 [Bombina bombina]|uniref:DNA transposase THAP9 n=1 Tax=Bombina bombina TaxID=8345 RepID=UPI00235AF0F1|nr:DNA transposase THAP9 [Bombina bombina]XP_053572456.1 DNA transposase THAP9 [Bombina bombina]